MRHVISIFLLSCFFATLGAQSSEEDVVRLKQDMTSASLEESSAIGQNTNQEVESSGETGQTEKQKRGQWNTTVGTSFTYSGSFGSYMGLYAAPTYTYSLNPRWSLHGGILAAGYQGLNAFAPEGVYQQTGNMGSLAVFAAASYRMSDRLVVHGAGVKQLLSTPMPGYMAYPSDNFSLGATYKLGDTISIGATIQMNRGHGYHGGGPFQGSYFSPYGW